MTSVHSLRQKDVAELLAVTPRTVRDWQSEGLPRLPDGHYSGPDVVRWFVARGQAGALDLDQERARLAKEQADRTALENGARRGELVDVAGVEREWTDHITAVRARLLAIPTSVGSQLDAEVAPKVAAIVKVLIHAALEELSHYAGGEPAARPTGDGPL